jgi:hypothetical protein
MLRLVLIIIIFLLLIGTLPSWPYTTGWGLGYYPTGGLGLILIILIILLLVDRRGLP